jgi:hypothetical protein
MRELQLVSNALKYEEYLVRKYLKSTTKLAFILPQLENWEHVTNLLTEIQLEPAQIAVVLKYLKVQG